MFRWSGPIRQLVALVTSLALLLPTLVTAPALAAAPGTAAQEHATGLPEHAAGHRVTAAAPADGDPHAADHHPGATPAADNDGDPCAGNGCALCAALAPSLAAPLADAPVPGPVWAVPRGDAGRPVAPETPPPIT